MDITKREQLEQTLRNRPDLLAGVIASAMDAIIAIDDEQRIVLFNAAAERMFACRADEAIGTPIDRFIPQRFRAEHSRHVRRFGETGVTSRDMGTLGILWGLRSTGEEFPIEAAISKVETGGTEFFAVVIRDLTERHRAEETMRESEQRFRLVADSAPVLIWMSGTDKCCTYFNKPWLDFTGRSVEEEHGSGWTEGVHPEDLQRCLDTYTQSFDRRDKFRMEYRLRHHDGEYRQILDVGVPRFTEDGSFAGYIGICVDVNERKRAEEAALRHTAIVESSEDAIMATDVGGTVTDWNNGAERLFGYSSSEAIGKKISFLSPPDHLEEASDILKKVMHGEAVKHYETGRRRKDGTRVDISLTVSPIVDAAGKVVGASGIARDITERKRAEDALRENEARERSRAKELETILDTVPIPVLIAHDAGCRRITGNRAAQKQMGLAAGQNFSKSAPSNEQPKFRVMEAGVEVPAESLPMQQALMTGEPVYGRSQMMVLDDGTKLEILVSAAPLLDDEGKATGAVGALIDVTELKQAERTQREIEDKLRLLLDSTAEAIYGIDLEHRCTFCNPACLRALGYERIDEVLGKNMHALIHHSRPDGTSLPVEECPMYRVARTGEGVHAGDAVLWRANGTSFPAEYWCYPQQRGQQIVGAVVAFIDITERKLAEAALANASRRLIEAQEQERARIARELHDDINQRLALAVIELEQWGKEHSNIDGEVHERIYHVKQCLFDLGRDVQALSHRLHSSKLDYLGLMVAAKSFCRELSEQQKVEIDFTHESMLSDVPREVSLCLFRILQEALQNAVKYSGVQNFRVKLEETPAEIKLTISDDGVGFDQQAALRGRGLGLTSMRERMQLVKGELSITSQPDRGTTVCARVPFVAEDHRTSLADDAL